jgi:hypothetical protein
VLLTGDNQRTADVGIAGLLPQHKVGAVRELENAGRNVLDVGDAVNDALALPAARTGVAMGWAGSDLTLWCALRPPAQTTKNPRVIDLGVRVGAGDENRTRTLSLGSDGAWMAAYPLTCNFIPNRSFRPGVLEPLLTVVVPSYGHALGTGLSRPPY